MVNIKKHDSVSISKLDDQNLMLTDDFQLLELMIEDSLNQSVLYQPGARIGIATLKTP